MTKNMIETFQSNHGSTFFALILPNYFTNTRLETSCEIVSVRSYNLKFLHYSFHNPLPTTNSFSVRCSIVLLLTRKETGSLLGSAWSPLLGFTLYGLLLPDKHSKSCKRTTA